MSIESQTQVHVPFRLEAQIIAAALDMACIHDGIRRCFPPANRSLLFDLRDKWQALGEEPVSEGGPSEGTRVHGEGS